MLDKRSGTELLQPAAAATSCCCSPSTRRIRAGPRAPGCSARPGPAPAAPWARPGVRAERCPVGSSAGRRARAGRAARHAGDAAVGRRGPGGVPHSRRRLDRPGPAAAGRVPGGRAGRAAGLPDRGRGDRAGRRARPTPTWPSTPTRWTTRPASGSRVGSTAAVALTGADGRGSCRRSASPRSSRRRACAAPSVS